MKAKTEYEAKVKAADLATIAKAAKCIHPEVTVSLSENEVSFWAKDDRKECAIAGVIPLKVSADGALTIRAKAEQVAAVAAAIPKAKTDVALRILADGDELTLAVESGGVARTATVTEAEEDDQPFQPADYKAVASCNVDLMAFAQVLAGFVRNADVVTVRYLHQLGFTVSYKTRDHVESWKYPQEDVKGEGEARFRVKLLLAAVKAAKVVGTMAKVQISKDGPMRILVRSENGMKATAYVVSSQSIQR